MSTVGAEVGEQMERAEDASSPQELLCDNFFRGSVRREEYSPVCLAGSSKYRRAVGSGSLGRSGYTIWSWLADPGGYEVRSRSENPSHTDSETKGARPGLATAVRATFSL